MKYPFWRPLALVLVVLLAFAAKLSTTLAQSIESDCKNPDSLPEDSIPSFWYHADKSQNDEDQKARQAKDFAEYFVSYGELHHQKDMLTDKHRMDSYYTAIMANAKAAFEGKIVMDVGTGSGILATWAAKAGAKKVYAIEYTDMAKNARKLAEANGVSDVVTVLQGTVEGIELPLKEDGFLLENGSEQVVDVIVSEWMGYILLRESMLDSVLVARDKYLRKDTGLMFPSHATIYLAPIKAERRRQETIQDYEDAMADWYDFVENTVEAYGGVDYSILTEAFEKEQRDYYIYQSEWQELEESNVLAEPSILKTLDLMTCTHNDTRGIFGKENHSLESAANGNADTNEFDFVVDTKTTKVITGFASWFTTDFKSRTDAMVTMNTPQLTRDVTLNTGPEQGYTHWGQQAFYLRKAIRIETDLKLAAGDLADGKVCGEDTTVHLKGSLELFRKRENTRLYACRITHSLEEVANDGQQIPLRRTNPSEAVYDIP